MASRTGTAALLALLAALALATTSCVPSLHSWIPESEAVFDPALVGSWVEVEDDGWLRLPDGAASDQTRWVVTRDGELGYSLRVVEGQGSDATQQGVYDALLARHGDATYLQLRARSKDNAGDEILEYHLIDGCAVYRIALSGDRLTHQVMSPEWMREALESRKFRLRHEVVGDRLVITASTSQLWRFLKRHGDDEGLFLRLDEALGGAFH